MCVRMSNDRRALPSTARALQGPAGVRWIQSARRSGDAQYRCIAPRTRPTKAAGGGHPAAARKSTAAVGSVGGLRRAMRQYAFQRRQKFAAPRRCDRRRRCSGRWWCPRGFLRRRGFGGGICGGARALPAHSSGGEAAHAEKAAFPHGHGPFWLIRAQWAGSEPQPPARSAARNTRSAPPQGLPPRRLHQIERQRRLRRLRRLRRAAAHSCSKRVRACPTP